MWEKIFEIYTFIVIFAAILFIWKNLKNNPKKKLDFITKAYKEGCLAVGKMTCLTLHGTGNPEYFKAEYMYMVDGKRYFVTYQMAYKIVIDDRMDQMNADMLLLKLKPALILFYDKKKPQKAMSKLEVFTSDDAMHQIKTPKENAWRYIEKDWTEPINLVHY